MVLQLPSIMDQRVCRSDQHSAFRHLQPATFTFAEVRCPMFTYYTVHPGMSIDVKNVQRVERRMRLDPEAQYYMDTLCNRKVSVPKSQTIIPFYMYNLRIQQCVKEDTIVVLLN